MSLFCPIINETLSVNDCGVSRCSYYRDGTCIENKVKALPPAGSPQRMIEVVKLFDVSRADVEDSVADIELGEGLRQFCVYLISKELIDVKEKDVEYIKSAKARYEAWTGCRGSKPKFSDLLYLLETSILPRL